MKSGLFSAACLYVLGCLFPSYAPASVLSEYTDLSTYNAAVGSHSIIDFDDGFPEGTVITDQYVGQDVIFTDGNDTIDFNPFFLTDGVGLNGNGRIDISFSSPINHIGIEFPGALQIEFYSGATLLDTSSQFGSGGTGFFGGAISTPFDRVVLIDWDNDTVFIDNLHFGTVIPIPAAVWLFGSGLLGLIGLSRRKKAA